MLQLTLCSGTVGVQLHPSWLAPLALLGPSNTFLPLLLYHIMRLCRNCYQGSCTIGNIPFPAFGPCISPSLRAEKGGLSTSHHIPPVLDHSFPLMTRRHQQLASVLLIRNARDEGIIQITMAVGARVVTDGVTRLVPFPYCCHVPNTQGKIGTVLFSTRGGIPSRIFPFPYPYPYLGGRYYYCTAFPRINFLLTVWAHLPKTFQKYLFWVTFLATLLALLLTHTVMRYHNYLLC